jgi:hypothetical protein
MWVRRDPQEVAEEKLLRRSVRNELGLPSILMKEDEGLYGINPGRPRRSMARGSKFERCGGRKARSLSWWPFPEFPLLGVQLK